MARSGLVFFKITWLVIEISTKLLHLKDFFTLFGFVAPSPSSFSKIHFFFALLTFLAGYLTMRHDRYGPFAAYAALLNAIKCNQAHF